MRKLSFLVGVGVGYFAGTRSGRRQFEQMRATGRTVWQDPRIQVNVQRVEDRLGQAARNQAAAMTDRVADAVKARIDAGGAGASPGSQHPEPGHDRRTSF